MHVAKDMKGVYGEQCGGSDIEVLEEIVSEGFLGGCG